jgi:hypothetical protein
MEASAFLHVCQHTGVISLGVVKGVSDMGDDKAVTTNDKHYNTALINTADAVRHWIGETPDTIKPKSRSISPSGLPTTCTNTGQNGNLAWSWLRAIVGTTSSQSWVSNTTSGRGRAGSRVEQKALKSSCPIMAMLIHMAVIE